MTNVRMFEQRHSSVAWVETHACTVEANRIPRLPFVREILHIATITSSFVTVMNPETRLSIPNPLKNSVKMKAEMKDQDCKEETECHTDAASRWVMVATKSLLVLELMRYKTVSDPRHLIRPYERSLTMTGIHSDSLSNCLQIIRETGVLPQHVEVDTRFVQFDQ